MPVRVYSALHALMVLQLRTASEIAKIIEEEIVLAERDGVPGPLPLPMKATFTKSLHNAAEHLLSHVHVRDLEKSWWCEIINASQRVIIPQREYLDRLLNMPIQTGERGRDFSYETPFRDLFTLLHPVPVLTGGPEEAESQEGMEVNLPQKG